MKDLIQAYLDDYDLVTIEVSKKFHQGKSDEFFLCHKDLKVKLDIFDTKELDDKVIYKTSLNDELTFSNQYTIYGPDNYPTILQYRYIVKTEKFNDDFYYDGSDLGCVVNDNKTTFKLWAPTANQVVLKLDNQFYDMVRTNRGVYQYCFDEDLNNHVYTYLIFVNGEVNECLDPYGKSITLDNQKNIVTKPISYQKVKTNKVERLSDCVIYESNVCDFSEKENFVSLIERVPYLKDLGIDVLQLMPVNSFGGVDNYHRETYNWGYNPIAYQSLQAGYGDNKDFIDLVCNLHRSGIKIVLDVVFNHHYNAEKSSFNYCVPYYYYRYDQFDGLSQGSYCGSEFASEMKMCRKYFVDTCKYYVQQFDVDGFRFDLMGLLDWQTINEIKTELIKIKEDILLYGEGWDMAAGLDNSLLANYRNYQKMDKVAFFNDYFRDVVKGDNFKIEQQGYASGDIWQVNQAMDCLLANRFDDPDLSIDYCQCHDNLTCYDKIVASCQDEDEKEIIKRCKLVLAFVLLSRGVSFIHNGQEYCNSKNGLANPYNVKQPNKIIFDQRYQEVHDFTKKLIEIRKQHHINSLANASVKQINCVIEYRANDLLIIINPLNNDVEYQLDGKYKDLLNNCEVEKQILVKEKEIAILEND